MGCPSDHGAELSHPVLNSSAIEDPANSASSLGEQGHRHRNQQSEHHLHPGNGLGVSAKVKVLAVVFCFACLSTAWLTIFGLIRNGSTWVFALQKPPGLFLPLDRKSPTHPAIIGRMKNESAAGNLEVEAGGPGPAAQVSIKLQESTRPRTLQFQEVHIGQFFDNRGRRYEKLALSMASDEDRNGNIFQAQVEVLPDPFLRNGPGPEASYPRTNQKP